MSQKKRKTPFILEKLLDGLYRVKNKRINLSIANNPAASPPQKIRKKYFKVHKFQIFWIENDFCKSNKI